MRIPRIRARRVDLLDEGGVKDNVTIEVRDPEGRLLEQHKTHNRVTDAGRSLAAARLENGTPTAGLTHFAVGTSSSTPQATDVSLGAEVFRSVITQYIPAAQKITVRYFLGTGDANGNTLVECGALNAASGGVLYARAVHNPVTKTASKTVTYSWDFPMVEVVA